MSIILTISFLLLLWVTISALALSMVAFQDPMVKFNLHNLWNIMTRLHTLFH